MAPQVTAIRVGQRPVHTRVVIDTDGPATYTRTILDRPYREVRWAQFRPTVVRAGSWRTCTSRPPWAP